MIEKTKQLVAELMKNEDSGHGMDHVMRVYALAMKFAQTETCDKNIVALGALLHDVDDYKLFGTKNQAELTNTRIILDKLGADNQTQQKVLDIVKTIGYTKRLKGIFPTSIEGKIVSDADMCDAAGAMGIIRTFQYSIKFGKPFFNKDIWPDEDIIAGRSLKKASDTAVCHFFEKLLKLKNFMLTDSGKQEAAERHRAFTSFLRQVFREENAPEWEEYLDKYLEKNEEIEL
ncbi:MAG: HD domain-containing protein [Clostridia bacterium]|nr:HD domain-containing protein [Clostridia bacterium]